jgi:ABC-type glycerol-3-phosphate transport system permease component
MRATPAERLIARLTIGVLTAVVLGPMAWALMTSFKTEATVITFPPTFFPSPATGGSYAAVFLQKNFATELFNSVFYAIASVVLTLAVSVPAGYAASRMTFPAKRAVMLLVLATSMVPGVALLIPTYFVLDAIGLLNNPVAIIVLQAARLVPQTIWFMQNFVDAVPVELDEATQVDGATRWQTFAQVILPLIKPGIAAAAVLGVITTWNDYITVAAFAPDLARRTLQVALVNQVFDSIGITWSYVMAFAIISSLPIVALFLVAQRWFIAGLTAGAVKG